MKKMIAIGLLALGGMSAGTANATAILDPNTTENYFFQWSGFDQIDRIYEWDGVSTYGDLSTNYGNDWSITVAEDSTMDFVTAWDGFIAGDIFELVLDGSVVAWTSTYTDGSGYFHGVFDDLFLSAGTHNLTFNVVSGLSSGGAYATFSAVTTAVSVPEPASLAMLGLGLAGLGFARKKRAA